jgi:hypothetical protein
MQHAILKLDEYILTSSILDVQDINEHKTRIEAISLGLMRVYGEHEIQWHPHEGSFIVTFTRYSANLSVLTTVKKTLSGLGLKVWVNEN